MAKKWEGNRDRNEIRRIQKAIISYITDRGYDIWVSYAKRTKSRYYEFFIAHHKLRIRLSDHISKKIQNFDYDIYVSKPRPNAFSYGEWLKDMEGKINAIEEQQEAVKNSACEFIKIYKIGEF